MESSYNHKKIIVVVAAAAMFGVGPALATTTTPFFCNPSEAIDVSEGIVVAKNQSYKMEGATQPVSGTVVKYAEADSAICLLDDSHNEFTLTGSTTEFGVVVAVKDVTVNLDNAYIASNRGAGISFEDGFNATLKFKGNNYITGFDGYAGIAKTSESGKLTIDGTSKENTLGVNGGAGSAAIGGNSQQKMVSNIEILAGTINAVGGQYGAAIGGGQNGAASKITIGKETDKYYYNADDALTLSVTGGNDGGAGIGGGSMGGADTIVINNGYITANAPATAAIGAGAGMNCMDITINNGVLHAVGGSKSSAIGADGTTGTSCSGIVINNGSINAYAGSAASGDTKAIGKKESVTITGGSIMAVSSNETYDDIMDPKDAQGSPVHRFNIKATKGENDRLFVRSTETGKFSAEAAVAQGEVFKNDGDWDNGKFFPTHHLDVDMNAGGTINQQDKIWAFFGENEEHDVMVNPTVTEDVTNTVESSGKTSRIKWDATQSKFIYNIALLNSFPHDFLVYNGYEQGVKVDSSKIWIMGPDSSAFVRLSKSSSESKTNNYFKLNGDSLTNANVKCQEEFVSRSVSVPGNNNLPTALYCNPNGYLEGASDTLYTMTAKDKKLYGKAQHVKFMLPYVLDNMDKEGSLEPQTNDAKDPIVLAGGFNHLIYNGAEQTQEVDSVTLFNKTHYVTDQFQNYVLVAGTDYEVSDNKGTDASKLDTLKISAKGTNFVGSAKRNFVIKPFVLANAKFTFNPDSLVYNAKRQTQDVSEMFICAGEAVDENCYLLGSNPKDLYEITDTIETDAGAHAAKVAKVCVDEDDFCSNVKGSIEPAFRIAKYDITSADVKSEFENDLTYDPDPLSGNQIQKVKSASLEIGDTTVELTYSSSSKSVKDAGDYSIALFGSKNFTGSHDVTFYVKPFDIATAKYQVVLTNEEYVDGTNPYDAELDKDLIYNGTEQEQHFGVWTGTNTLDEATEEGVNYTYTGNTAMEIGYHEIVVTGQGNYTGTITQRWAITSGGPIVVTVKLKDSTAVYDGKEHVLAGRDLIESATYQLADNESSEPVPFSLDNLVIPDSIAIKGTDVGGYSREFDNEIAVTAGFVVEGRVAYSDAIAKLTIEKASVEVAIAGKSDTATFDNQEHKFAGYDVTIPEAWAEFLRAEDIICTGCDSVVGRNANEYALGLSAEKFASANGNFDASFNVTDGKLVIEKALVPVKIVSNNATKTFNGKQQKAEGFTLEAVNASQAFVSADSVIYKGDSFVAGVNVGEYALKLDTSLFESVSNNYAVKVVELEDGKLSIEPAPISISVVGKTDSVFYDSKEHSLTGYDVMIPEEWKNFFSEEAVSCNDCGSAVGTNVGEYPLVLKAENFKSNNDNFVVDFNVTNGSLVIDKAPIEVKITGKTETKSYAAKTFTVSGYDAEVTKNVSNVLFDKSDIVMLNGAAKVSAKNAGKYSMGLKAENFAYDNQNYNVTFTIASDGELEIKPAYVTVTIEGARDTVVYDGEKHSVSGYTVTASDSNFGSDDYEFIGKSSDAKVSGKKAGVFYMNLADSLFKFEGNNFTGKFVVKNGSLTIVKPKTEAIRATRVSLVRVCAIEGGIVVDNAYGKAISVFSVNGKAVYNNVRSENTSGSTVISVPRGMYVVKVGSDVQRVTVK